ncbi:hypothetical protein X898_1467 [Burkholderia pseudomallei ABCPW 91]|nr:hypothetical protein X898_1467 [Burkholderia pseudomallei ABCPW 91]
MPLTDTAIRNAKPADKPVRLFDGGGLYLEIAPSGGKWWRLKYRFGGKEKRYSLGVYPEVPLAAARKKRDEAREKLAAGIDPGEAKKAEKRASLFAAAHSFEIVARSWMDERKTTVEPAQHDKTLARMENDVFPWLGKRPIAEIDAPRDTGCAEACRRARSKVYRPSHPQRD